MHDRVIGLLAALLLFASACRDSRSPAGLGGSATVPASTVIPNANAGVRGDLALSTLETAAPRTYMLGIASSQLTGIPIGAVINGMSFRASTFRLNDEQWPENEHLFPACRIRIGRAKPLATWKKKFSDNFESSFEVARQGPLVIPARTFSNDVDLPAPAANRWGTFFWDFRTPFTYEGGDLAIQVSHLGGSGGTAMFFDAVASDPANGVIAFTGEGYNVETGVPAAFTVLRLHYGFGAGCAGSNGRTATLVLAQERTSPSEIEATLQIAGGLANAPAALALGIERADLALGNGCTLLTNPAALIAAPLDASGGHISRLTVPIVGLDRLVVQAVLIDTAAERGYRLSNGVEVRE